MGDGAFIVVVGGLSGLGVETALDVGELVRGQVGVEPPHRVVTVPDRDVPVGSLCLSSFDGQILLDALDESTQPHTQLGRGVVDCVGDDSPVETFDRLWATELITRRTSSIRR